MSSSLFTYNLCKQYTCSVSRFLILRRNLKTTYCIMLNKILPNHSHKNFLFKNETKSSLLARSCLSIKQVMLCHSGLHFKGKHHQLKTHTCGGLTALDVGKTVRLRGFLQFQRMGKFLVLRDYFGKTQILINDEYASSLLKETPYESYLEVIGKVILRPEDQINKEMKTGEIEVLAEKFVVLNKAKDDIPFLIRDQNRPNESLALKYRYLDLRHQYLQENLRFRSQLGKRMRDYLQDIEEFIEITTPSLSVNTPGGSQEFVVPTQLGNKFYSLVQSPQTYKQLAIIGGFEKYFQFAICFRDEGGKPDRQPEFMQLDIEIADATIEEVRNLIENLIFHSWPKDFPTLTTSFPSMTHSEAMNTYGVDKPDTRFEWKIIDVSQIISISESPLSDLLSQPGSSARAFVIPNGEKNIKKQHIKLWESIAQKEVKLPGVFVGVVKGDQTLKGNTSKGFPREISGRLIEALSAKCEDVIVLSAGLQEKPLKLLGKLRLLAADILESNGVVVRDSKRFDFLWIIDFPLFERDEETGELISSHHPFTAPHEDDINLLYECPVKARSQHYDLVLNGCEIAGGSIRVHNPEMQNYILKILNIESLQLQFLLEALSCGAPPHGGIALGFDRYISILRNSKSIREVMAFPKSSEGKCLMSGAPSTISEKDRKLYNLVISTHV